MRWQSLRPVVLLGCMVASPAWADVPQTAPAVVEAGADVTAPTVYVVKMHADWCGGCKRIGDLTQRLAPLVGSKQVRYLTLDSSDPAKRDILAVKAKALGLTDLVQRNGGKTGVVYVVNASSSAVYTMLTANDDLPTMARAVKAALSEGREGEVW